MRTIAELKAIAEAQLAEFRAAAGDCLADPSPINRLRLQEIRERRNQLLAEMLEMSRVSATSSSDSPVADNEVAHTGRAEREH
jgi:hypothetical protein